MFFWLELCDVWYTGRALYITMILNKACGDALNVCRVSPRVGVVTVDESGSVIG